MTSPCPTYLNFFRTGSGLAAANCYIYNEDCLLNNLRTWCPGLQSTEHAGPFCMMEEVLAVAASDPVMLGVRTGFLRRGFPEYAQAFAKAYLALPALPSEIVVAGVNDKDIVVRRIRSAAGTYFAVINRGFALAGKETGLSCFPRGADVTDRTTGETMATAADGTCRMTLAPMSLRSFLVK